MLADKAIEAVLIATSTDTHVPLLTAAAKAGKAVLCEKPIDLDIARAEACWAEIGKLNPLVMIGFNRRFDPSFKAVRDRIAAGSGTFPVVGNPDRVAGTFKQLSDAGLDGMAAAFVNYLDELPFFCEHVLPRMERLALRSPVN